MYYNSGAASRLTSNLPKHDPESSFNTDFLEEDLDNKGIISSLISDGNGRNPFNLIQEDFPSTPSNIYSSRLLSTNAENHYRTEGSNDESLSGRHTSRLSNGIQSTAALSAQHSAVDNSLEHASLAMQQLYVSVHVLVII